MKLTLSQQALSMRIRCSWERSVALQLDRTFKLACPRCSLPSPLQTRTPADARAPCGSLIRHHCLRWLAQSNRMPSNTRARPSQDTRGPSKRRPTYEYVEHEHPRGKQPKICPTLQVPVGLGASQCVFHSWLLRDARSTKSKHLSQGRRRSPAICPWAEHTRKKKRGARI